jgi:hypothetical protein
MAAKKKPTTAIANFDEELAQLARESADQEAGVGGGSFFSIQGGQLTFNGNPVPENRLLAVVVDSLNENVYYEDTFDPDNPTSPACYAFGRSDDDMRPHEDVDDPKAETCASCPMNEWGSADVGRGKACRNRRRLALLQAGTIQRDGSFEIEVNATSMEREELCYLGLPPTSLKGWAAYVKKLSGTINRPPLAVVTEITVVPDKKSQFKVTFELAEQIDDRDAIKALMARRKEAQAGIGFAYPKRDDAPKPARGGRGKAPARRKAPAKDKKAKF